MLSIQRDVTLNCDTNPTGTAEIRSQFTVAAENAGMRLDDFLADNLPMLSRMRIATLTGEASCLVNRVAAPPGRHLESGDLVEIRFDPATPNSMTPEAIPLDIAYQDSHIVVVVKPAGMLVHPTSSVKSGTLANALAFYLNHHESGAYDTSSEASDSTSVSHKEPLFVRPGIVHRLDKATSGLMVVAKTKRSHAILSRHFRRRLVEKRYLALVRGEPDRDSFEVNAPIGRDPERHPRWWVSESGKPAETRLTVLERHGNTTLLQAMPITGRTNQIRIHCALAGYPIVGDNQYSEWAGIRNKEVREEPFDSGWERRLCLHASLLGFHHPATGQWIEITSGLPEDWPA